MGPPRVLSRLCRLVRSQARVGLGGTCWARAVPASGPTRPTPDLGVVTAMGPAGGEQNRRDPGRGSRRRLAVLVGTGPGPLARVAPPSAGPRTSRGVGRPRVSALSWRGCGSRGWCRARRSCWLHAASGAGSGSVPRPRGAKARPRTWTQRSAARPPGVRVARRGPSRPHGQDRTGRARGLAVRAAPPPRPRRAARSTPGAAASLGQADSPHSDQRRRQAMALLTGFVSERRPTLPRRPQSRAQPTLFGRPPTTPRSSDTRVPATLPRSPAACSATRSTPARATQTYTMKRAARRVRQPRAPAAAQGTRVP